MFLPFFFFLLAVTGAVGCVVRSKRIFPSIATAATFLATMVPFVASLILVVYPKASDPFDEENYSFAGKPIATLFLSTFALVLLLFIFRTSRSSKTPVSLIDR